MTRTVKPSAIRRRTVCTPMKPAPPVTRMRFGVFNNEALVAADGGAAACDAGGAVPRAAGCAPARAQGDLVRSLAGAGAGCRARGFQLYRGAGLAIPAAVGQRPAAPAADHPGRGAEQLGGQPDSSRAER